MSMKTFKLNIVKVSLIFLFLFFLFSLLHTLPLSFLTSDLENKKKLASMNKINIAFIFVLLDFNRLSTLRGKKQLCQNTVFITLIN